MSIEIGILLKFGKEEHIKDLQENGNVFMNTIEWFKNYEKDGIGDLYEGAFEVTNIVNAKLTFKFPERPITLDSKKLQLRKHYKGHVGNIFSTYALSTKLLRRKNIHRIDKRMNKFGTHCLMIKDIKKFMDSIRNELDKLKINYSYGLVDYKNLSKNNHELTNFQKTHKLSYQKEYRIIAWTNQSQVLKLNIGSMKDYTELYNSEELIESLIMELK